MLPGQEFFLHFGLPEIASGALSGTTIYLNRHQQCLSTGSKSAGLSASSAITN